MKANEFLHKKDVAYMNRLSTPLDFDRIVSLMEEYAALHIADVSNCRCGNPSGMGNVYFEGDEDLIYMCRGKPAEAPPADFKTETFSKRRT